MKFIIFAGGSGKRFWPISRVKLPKQFVPIINGKSTIQLSVDRLKTDYGLHNIYISTNEKYVSLVKEHIPEFYTSNIITEPARRDLAAAVGLSLIKLRKFGITEPVFIGWADHLIENEGEFHQKIIEAEKSIRQGEYKIVFWGEVPKDANPNLGWMKATKTESSSVAKYEDWVYRPELETCREMFKSGKWFINTGYFITTIDYLLSIYEKHQPDMYSKLVEIEEAINTDRESEVLEEIYPTLKSISFDEAIGYNIPKEDVGMVISDMGWEDPGSLYALKKHFAPGDKNYIKGKGLLKNTKDSMIFNEEEKKMIVGLDLDEVLIVNTKDVLLVTKNHSLKNLKKLLKEFEDNDKFKKYL